MRISYAVTVCNEFLEIQKLIPFLLNSKRSMDQVIVLYDETSGDTGVEEYLRATSIANPSDFMWYSKPFAKNFAEWKNLLTSLCDGDYIINVDADEMPSHDFIANIDDILRDNPEIDMFVIPRRNIVNGITPQHIAKWGWRMDEQNRINWPDYQMRVYKNNKNIKWINPVHEVLTGFQTFAPLPDEMYFDHIKGIEKQERQNIMYSNL
jgi:hypothetical protein